MKHSNVIPLTMEILVPTRNKFRQLGNQASDSDKLEHKVGDNATKCDKLEHEVCIKVCNENVVKFPENLPLDFDDWSEEQKHFMLSNHIGIYMRKSVEKQLRLKPLNLGNHALDI